MIDLPAMTPAAGNAIRAIDAGPATLDAGRYREAMAGLGAAVNIVTSAGPAGRVGLTASAVCSVTDTPPTLLVCVNGRASSHDAAIANGVLCVNTLRAEHEALSRRFGGGTPMPDRFAGATWQTLATGAPVLEDALVAFDCRIASALRCGTHTVLFCEVVDTQLPVTGARGLMYFARQYLAVSA